MHGRHWKIAICVIGAWCTTASAQEDEIPTKCPRVDPMNTTVHLAHETDCTKFYACSNGRKILMECPLMDARGNRLHFNPRLQVCDYPRRAGCKLNSGTITLEPTEGSTDSDRTDSTPRATESPISSTSRAPEKPTTQSSVSTSHATAKPTASTAHSTEDRTTQPSNSTSHATARPTEKPSESTSRVTEEAKSTPPISTAEEPTATSIITTSHATAKPTQKPTESTSHATESPTTQPPISTSQATAKPTATTSRTTEQPTSKPSTSTSHATAKPTEKPTESTSRASESPEESTSRATDKPTTKPSISTSHSTAEPTTSEPTEKPTASTSNTTEKSTTKPPISTTHATAKPTTSPTTEKPTESTSEATAKPTTSTSHTTQKPTESTSQATAKPTASTSHATQKPTTSTSITTESPEGSSSPDTELPESSLPTTENAGFPTDDFDSNDTTARPSGPPPICSKDVTGIYFPHEFNCSLFYECIHGDLILKQCAERLYFDASLQTCVWPSETNCRLSISSSSPTTPTTAKPTTPVDISNICPTDNSKDGQLYPHECVCNKYYVCNNGKVILQQCPPDLDFNPDLSTCDWPKNAGCRSNATSTTPGGPSTSSVIIPTECPLDNSGEAVQLAHPTNCSLFYKCDNGNKVLMECQYGLYFNSKRQVCDWPENAGCIGVTATAGNYELSTKRSDTTIETQPPPIIGAAVSTLAPLVIARCPQEGNSKIPHETDCHLYYECKGGVKTLKECSEGLDFNPVLRICDWPEFSGCSHSSIDGSSPIADYEAASSSSSSARTTKRPTAEDGCLGSCPEHDPLEYAVLLEDEDCGKFCECSNGKAFEKDCPAGLHFNSVDNVCDYPQNAKCNRGK